MTECLICRSDEVEELIDFGMQPVCHKFLKSADADDKKYPLALGFCNGCGLVQLTKAVIPAGELEPVYAWVTYNEPEEHLDKVAEILSEYLSKDSKILGVSFKDNSTVERLRRAGFVNVHNIDVKNDLNAKISGGGVETIQRVLTLKKAKQISEKKGKFDLVIARHILEHAYSSFEFMQSLRALLNPGGHILLEVPDYTKPFEMLDYSSLWEEHIAYFTQQTFKNSLGFLGFSVERFELFEYPLENSLVALVKPLAEIKNHTGKKVIGHEKERVIYFSGEFHKRKKFVYEFLSECFAKYGKAAIFGAGHAACFLINIFEIGSLIDCVIDDDMNKQNLLMPGSKLQIFNSSALAQRGIKICAFVINTKIEDKVIAKNGSFMEKGGRFLSFSPVSPHSIFNMLKKVNSHVYYAGDGIVKIGKQEIGFLKNRLAEENLERIRLCAHRDINDPVHEMFIVLKNGSYIRPHRHLNKPESFYLVEGSADIIIFDDDGKIKEIIKMGESPGQKFFYRMNEGIFHTLIVLSEMIVYHEVTSGPFNKTDTVFAQWSPQESDKKKAADYLKQLISDAVRMK